MKTIYLIAMSIIVKLGASNFNLSYFQEGVQFFEALILFLCY